MLDTMCEVVGGAVIVAATFVLADKALSPDGHEVTPIIVDAARKGASYLRDEATIRAAQFKARFAAR